MHFSTPISSAQFINVTPINDLISKCQIKVCYIGQEPNRNKSVITKEVATRMANSLPGSPIVGFYNEETQDFMGHEEEMIITDKAIEFKPLTTPYGFVDINAKVWFQWFLDDNQYEREYLVTEGYIWTGRYPEAKRVISQGNNQSMELDRNSTTGVWTKDSNNKPQFFIINEANISALCLLGEDVEPCFEGAQVASQFTLSEDFKNTFTLMAKELKEILSEGGNTMNEEMTTVEEVVEETVVEEPVEETTETEEEVVVEETPAEEVEEVSDVEEEIVESEGQNDETETEENLENNEGNFSETEEEVEESESEVSEQSAYSLDEIPEYTELRTNYSALEANYNALLEEIVPLRAFKAAADKAEKEALIRKFYMLSDEDKKNVVENIDNYSLAEIEAQLAVICFRNKVNFNLEEEEKEEDTNLTFNLEASKNEFDNAPDWIKAVRATKESNI